MKAHIPRLDVNRDRGIFFARAKKRSLQPCAVGSLSPINQIKLCIFLEKSFFHPRIHILRSRFTLIRTLHILVAETVAEIQFYVLVFIPAAAAHVQARGEIIHHPEAGSFKNITHI